MHKNITRLNISHFSWQEYLSEVKYYAQKTNVSADDVFKAMYRLIKKGDFTLLLRPNCLILCKVEKGNLHVSIAIGGGNEVFATLEAFGAENDVKTWTFSSVRKGLERGLGYAGIDGIEVVRRKGDRVYFRRKV